MAPTQPLRVASRNGPPPAIVAPILGLAALGALVVIPLVALAAIPLLVATLFAVGGVVAFVLSVWALIEGLAAFERWIESDRRFRQ
ncbi:glypican [Synechococcus sp. CBW1108]|uniref:glypican n=1 Tax=Synechococcus sp. CBW1108 TaxID=1353147 RepID=UPI001E4686DB|nr:glypican [Synechococcus sp. CBW1108]